MNQWIRMMLGKSDVMWGIEVVQTDGGLDVADGCLEGREGAYYIFFISPPSRSCKEMLLGK
jgi:hypothetical protein